MARVLKVKNIHGSETLYFDCTPYMVEDAEVAPGVTKQIYNESRVWACSLMEDYINDGKALLILDDTEQVKADSLALVAPSYMLGETK